MNGNRLMLNSSAIGKGVSEYLSIVRTTSSSDLRPKSRDNLLTIIPLVKTSFGANVTRNLRAEFEHCMLIGWRWAIGLLQYMAGEPLWDCLSSPSSSYITDQFPRRHHFLTRAANSLGDRIRMRDSPASASKSSSPVTIASTFAV